MGRAMQRVTLQIGRESAGEIPSPHNLAAYHGAANG